MKTVQKILHFNYFGQRAATPKNRYFFLILIAFVLGISPAFKAANGPRKVALIVAIGNYQNGNGWGNLSSLRDDTIITEALTKQGFETIFHLQNAKATRKGIQEAFANLEKNVNPGDIVYIHFSTHGQQLWDDDGETNGDEADGLDECIVPYDAPAQYKTGYKGEKHLRDDEIGQLVNKIRAKAQSTGQVLVVSDACHSGSQLRGPVCRGTEPPMIKDGFDPAKIKRSNDASVDEFTAAAASLSPVVLISASRAHETNQEFNGFGSLSLAFSHCIGQMKTGDTYRKLFAFINNEMGGMQLGQMPLIEGNIDDGIFGTVGTKQANYFSVQFVKSDRVNIIGGKLGGLYAGSKVALMEAGSSKYEAGKAIYEGIITSASYTSALLKTDKDLTKYSAKQLWVFVVEQAFGTDKLIVGSSPNLGDKTSEIKKNVSLLGFVDWNNKNAELFVGYVDGRYNISFADGRLVNKTFSSKEEINVFLGNYMQSKLIRQANFTDQEMMVTLTFNPKHYAGDDADGYPLFEDLPMSADGSINIVDDDVLFLSLSNNGNRDAYINILEIDPDGNVRVVLPDYENNNSAEDFKLAKGITNFPITTFARKMNGPIYGKYVYKVFATDVPVPFKSISLTRGAGGAQSNNPLAKLFALSYTTRGPENMMLSGTSSGGTTTEVTIRLNPPQK